MNINIFFFRWAPLGTKKHFTIFFVASRASLENATLRFCTSWQWRQPKSDPCNMTRSPATLGHPRSPRPNTCCHTGTRHCTISELITRTALSSTKAPPIKQARPAACNRFLIGGWTNPFAKYKSKWIISPRFGVKIKNIGKHFENTIQICFNKPLVCHAKVLHHQGFQKKT